MFDSLKNVLESLFGKEPDDFTLKIDGQEIQPLSARVLRTFDNPSDSFSASIFWDPSDKNLSELLRLFSYKPAKVFLGGELVLTGHVYNIDNVVSVDSCVKNIEGYTKTIDIVDSAVLPPFEFKDVSFADLVSVMLDPFDIDYTIEPEALIDANKKFEKVKSGRKRKLRNDIVVDAMQNRFEFLSDLARQRQLIISNDVMGNLVIHKPSNNPGLGLGPVKSLTDDKLPGYRYKISATGRKRYSSFTAYAKTPARKNKLKKNFKSFNVTDDNVPLFRHHSFDADSLGLTDLEEAVNFEKSRMLADAFAIEYPVNTWYSSDGILWQPNTLVSIESNYLELSDGFNFLIRSVEYNFGMDGPKAVLTLVPPEVFTGADIKDPWSTDTDTSTSLKDKILNG